MSKDSTAFDVHIVPYAWRKLNLYAKEALPNEIGGLARLNFKDDAVFVMDVEMLPQSSSGAFFELDESAAGDFTRRLIKEGRTDEIPEWCSIVHSHPVGASPSMSGVDVQQIKDFAHEQDAFSLIISASRDAKSTRMAMHYCCNVRDGRKVIIPDMPVKMAYMLDRIELGKKMRDVVRRHYKLVEDEDMSVVETLCEKFCIETLPGVLPSEEDELAAEAKERVPQLVRNRYTSSSGWQGGGGYSSPYGFHAAQQRSGPWNTEPPKTTSKEIVKADALPSLPSEQVRRMSKAERESWHRDLQLANGFDPATKGRTVTEKVQKRARKRLQRLAEKYKAPSLELVHEEHEPEISVGDIVVIKDSAIDSAIDQCISGEDRGYLEALTLEPTVVVATDGVTITIEDGFDFFRNDLILLVRGDEEPPPEVKKKYKIEDYLLSKSSKIFAKECQRLESGAHA